MKILKYGKYEYIKNMKIILLHFNSFLIVF